MTVSINEQERQALVTSLRLLTATPKSRKGLEAKLLEKGFEREIVQKTLEKLEREGLVNDRAFAHSVIQVFLNHRPSGHRRIAFELEKRGIQKVLARELLDQCSPAEERERAVELAKQKQLRWSRIEERRRRKKIYDFLVRRGFDYTLSREVVEAIENGTSP